jgi:hypothetical protein
MILGENIWGISILDIFFCPFLILPKNFWKKKVGSFFKFKNIIYIFISPFLPKK